MTHRLLARLGLGGVAATGLALLVLALTGLVQLDGPLRAAAAQERVAPQRPPAQDVVGCPRHHRGIEGPPPAGQEL